MAIKSESYPAATRAQAEQIVSQLKAANISSEEISIHYPDGAETRTPIKNQSLNPFYAVIGCAVAGGIICAALGWTTASGRLAIPGADAIRVAGPFSSLAIGAAVGLLLGGLLCWIVILLFSKDGLEADSNNVVAANIVVSVNTPDTERFVRAKNIFDQPVGTENPAPRKP